MTAIVEPAAQAEACDVTPGVTYELAVANENDGFTAEQTIPTSLFPNPK